MDGRRGSSPGAPPAFEDFDNDFSERLPEEKIKRATAIVLTQMRKDEDRHRVVITEIIKKVRDVSLYYQVGDELDVLSHVPSPACAKCEEDRGVAFFIGNPAQFVYSVSFTGERIQTMGGLSLRRLRELARSSEEATH